MAFGWTGNNGQDGTDGPSTNGLAELRAYWEALREGDMLPRRARVDPRGIAGVLEQSFLIERIAPGIARFRIAGMIFNDLMAMDIRGMPMSSLFLTAARDRLQMDLERVFRSPAIVTLDLAAERALGRAELRGKMQILPLISHEGRSDLAIGCIALRGDLRGAIGASFGQSPRRFDITNAYSERLSPQVGMAQAAELPDDHALSSGSGPGLVPPSLASPSLAVPSSAASSSPQRAQPGVPYLRLVHG